MHASTMIYLAVHPSWQWTRENEPDQKTRITVHQRRMNETMKRSHYANHQLELSSLISGRSQTMSTGGRRDDPRSEGNKEVTASAV